MPTIESSRNSGAEAWEWAGSEREFRRAIELNPGSPDVHFFAHFSLIASGRVEESLAEMKRALRQDPLSPLFNTHLAWMYRNTQQLEQAIASCRFAIELDPNLWMAHWLLALAYFTQGLFDTAITIAERGIALFGHNPLLMMCLGAGYASAGRSDEARQLLEELEMRTRTGYVSAIAISTLHFALGEIDQGLDWLATAVEVRDPMVIVSLKGDVFYDPLRAHPAFQALLRKMNLQP